MGKRSREKKERKLQDHNYSGEPKAKVSQFEKYCLLAIEWGTYLALLTPFIFLRDYFFPFIVPKTIYFRIMVDIIFVPYVLLAVSNPKYRPKFNVLTIAIGIFIAVATITSITGINFTKSFWSVFERMTGLLTFYHLFAFYIILTSCFRERKYWERFLAASMIVGIIICIYTWTSQEASARGGGTIGNTSFMSAYLLFNIFFGIMLFFTKNMWWKIFSVVSLAVLLAGIFISIEPTQGAIGALFIGLFVLGFSYLIFQLLTSGQKKMKWLAIGLVAFVILSFAGSLQLGFVKQEIANIWNSTSIQSRLVVWNMGFQGWQERFWLGWGQENFNIPFVKYFDPELPLTQDLWYDRVHNIVLDTAVTSGLVGLISYFAIYAIAMLVLYKVSLKVTEKKNLLFPLGMGALLVTYFVQNFWVFDMISSYVMFFFSLAFIYFLTASKEVQPEPILIKESRGQNPIASFSAAALIILAIVVLYFGNIQPAQASRLTIRGLVYPLEQSIPYFQQALAISPISQFEVPEQFAIRLLELSRQPVKDISLLQNGLVLAEEELKKEAVNDPLNFRVMLFLGRFYSNLFQMFGDDSKIAEADKMLLDAVKLSPDNQQVYWTLGQTRLFQERKEEAIEYFKKSVELNPRYGVSHWYLSMGYRISGQYELAMQELKEAEKYGYNYRGNIDDLRKALEVYSVVGDMPTVLPLLESAVELAPEDFELWARLADLYAQSGQKEKAKIAAERVLALAPDRASEINNFLKELGY